MEKGDKFGLNIVLSEIKGGNNPAQISKKFQISKQTLAYSVDKLRKLGCIEKVGYGVWRFIKEVPIRPKGSVEVKLGLLKPIRGHAFIWVINFPGFKYEWKQIIENYKKRNSNHSKLTFSLICNKRVVRTVFKNRKIWLTNRGMTIYEPLDFYGKSAFQVKGTAIYEMDNLIKGLLEELGQQFQTYFFNCSREHFAHIHNQMAKQFNDKKERILVEWDGKHFWIDHSDHVNEEETDDAKTSVQAHNFYKSQMKTNFEVTPEFILEGLNKTLEVGKHNEEKLEYYAENQVTHVKLMQNIDANLEKQTQIFEQIKNFMSNFKHD